MVPRGLIIMIDDSLQALHIVDSYTQGVRERVVTVVGFKGGSWRTWPRLVCESVCCIFRPRGSGERGYIHGAFFQSPEEEGFFRRDLEGGDKKYGGHGGDLWVGGSAKMAVGVVDVVGAAVSMVPWLGEGGGSAVCVSGQFVWSS